jgi:hypothetical protein
MFELPRNHSQLMVRNTCLGLSGLVFSLFRPRLWLLEPKKINHFQTGSTLEIIYPYKS